jgi:hypothetical protein
VTWQAWTALLAGALITAGIAVLAVSAYHLDSPNPARGTLAVLGVMAGVTLTYCGTLLILDLTLPGGVMGTR